MLSAVSHLPGGKCCGEICLVSSAVKCQNLPVSRAIYNAASSAIFIAGIIPDSSAIYNAVSSAIFIAGIIHL